MSVKVLEFAINRVKRKKTEEILGSPILAEILEDENAKKHFSKNYFSKLQTKFFY